MRLNGVNMCVDYSYLEIAVTSSCQPLKSFKIDSLYGLSEWLSECCVRVMFMFGMRLVFICELETERERKQNKKNKCWMLFAHLFCVFLQHSFLCVAWAKRIYSEKNKKTALFCYVAGCVVVVVVVAVDCFFLFAEWMVIIFNHMFTLVYL